MKNCKMKLKRN